MPVRSALKLVEPLTSASREALSWPGDVGSSAHSLHYILSYPESVRAEIPGYLISKYSPKSGVVLDPFSRGGAVALEANLLGRAAFCSDLEPLSLRIARGRVEVADITEVTLRLQRLNLRRPVSLDSYHSTFRPFYAVDTFRELVNLKTELQAQGDRVSRFIETISLGLLHGHSAGYFSVYTFPQFSLLPAEQEELNIKRAQLPDYRAVVPRILRRTAQALQDGGFSALEIMEGRNRYDLADPRNLAHLASSSVDLVVTAPPLPSLADGPAASNGLWLKFWFAGIRQADSRSGNRSGVTDRLSLSEWPDYMNECLFELARVTKARGRAALILRELHVEGKSHYLDEILADMVDRELSRMWEVEALILRRDKTVRLKDALDERADARSRKTDRILVLRRR